MRVVVSGASGFLGRPLVDTLRGSGHDVVRLVRGTAGSGESTWDPARGLIDDDVIATADAVINLSGAPISRWPRTRGHRAEILRSRVSSTRTLAESIARSEAPPAFLSGSGMSWYGVDRGDDALTEDASAGRGFLADVAQQWEEAAQPAALAGARVAFLRTSIVLDKSGGALKLMQLPFLVGLGAKLGSGDQWFSAISRRDWIAAVRHIVEGDLSGPINLAAPSPATNAAFTHVLAQTLHRPALLTAPEFALRPVLGSLADDLLGSLKVVPERLVDDGFTFADPTIGAIVTTALA